MPGVDPHTMAVRQGSRWLYPERVVGNFLDGARNDAQVVWEAAPGVTPPWRQAWPEPIAPTAIDVDLEPSGTKTAIRAIRWARVPSDSVLTPPAVNDLGDLVIRYTAALYWNPPANRKAPIDADANLTWPNVAAATGKQELTVRQRSNEWVLPAPIVLDDLTGFAIEVTAHYEFFDGTNPVDQDPAVARTSFFISEIPVTPLPPPSPVKITWITDTGSGPAAEGHFRNALTASAVTGQAGRPPVSPHYEYTFPALHNAPAATLDTPTRAVSVTIPGTSNARPSVPPDTTRVYDFAAQDAEPAVKGSTDITRRYVKDEVREYEVVLANDSPEFTITLSNDEVATLIEWELQAVPSSLVAVSGLQYALTRPPDRDIEVATETPENGTVLTTGTGVVTGSIDVRQWGGDLGLKLTGTKWGWAPTNTDTGIISAKTTITQRVAPDSKGVTPTPNVVTETLTPKVVAGKATRDSGPLVKGTIRVHVEQVIEQVGVGRDEPEPWDGVIGHPGDPGKANTAVDQVVTVTQQGVAKALPWDGIPGHAGDPGEARFDASRVGTWSWPFDVEFPAIVDAAGYQVNIGGTGWQDVPNVPATALGPAATGTITLRDRWLPTPPGGTITVLARAVKRLPTNVLQPGFAASASSQVPAYPTFGPARNLRYVDKGYRFATGTWDPPDLAPAAAHYFSGLYQIDRSGGAGQWVNVFGQTSFVDLGDVAVPALPNYRTDATPAGMVDDTGPYGQDPGAPGVDVDRPVKMTVRPLAAWNVAQPEASVTDMLVRKIVSWAQVVTRNSQVIIGPTDPAWREPDVVTTFPTEDHLFGWLIAGGPSSVPANQGAVGDARYYRNHVDNSEMVAGQWNDGWSGHLGGPGLVGQPVNQFGAAVGGAYGRVLTVSLVAAPGVVNPERLTQPPGMKINPAAGGSAAFALNSTGDNSAKAIFRVDGPPGWRVIGINNAWAVSSDGLVRKGGFFWGREAWEGSADWWIDNQLWWGGLGVGPGDHHEQAPFGYPGTPPWVPGDQRAGTSVTPGDNRFFGFMADWRSPQGFNLVSWSVSLRVQPPARVTPGTYHPPVKHPDHFLSRLVTYQASFNAP